MKQEHLLFANGLAFHHPSASQGMLQSHSSIFPHLPPNLLSNPEAQATLKKLNCISNELLDTEVSYLASLKEIKEVYSC